LCGYCSFRRQKDPQSISPRNIWSVCHTGCSYRTCRLGSSQFSTHCMSWQSISIGDAMPQQRDLPGTCSITSCKHPAKILDMSENVKTQPTVNIIPPISPGIKNFDGMMVEQWLTLRMRQFAKSSRVAYTLLYRVRAPLCRSVWHK
jgi:hypothetical protein